MKPGVYGEVTNDSYHSGPGISKSGLDLINRSPAHYWARYLDPNRKPQEPSPAMADGTALHTAILEPDQFDARYVVLDDHPELKGTVRTADELRDACTSLGLKPARSIAGMREQLVGANAAGAGVRLYDEVVAQLTNGRTPITQEKRDLYMRCRDAVRAHPSAGWLLDAGKAEMSGYAEDPETGVLVRVRPDWVSDDGIMVDLKSTTDARPWEFARSAYSFRYHVQAAMYTDVWTLASETALQGFVFVAFEKEPPFGVSVFIPDEEFITRGRNAYRRNLNTYAACVANDNWPGYPVEVQTLSLPAYAKD